MKNKFFYSLSVATIISAAALMGYLYYLAFFPFNAATIESPSEVLTPIVKTGEYLVITTKYCKYIDIPATVSRSFTNGVVISLPETTSNVPLGCGTVTRRFLVPPEILPGKYRLDSNFYYRLNIFQIQIIHATTKEFEVIE